MTQVLIDYSIERNSMLKRFSDFDRSDRANVEFKFIIYYHGRELLIPFS
jgi:hypothetical protein